ncbi:ABC transporter substrate-binding protein [Nostoc minutum NIES-26]|uniref:Putative aliphatic sulfonates-binding protein n=1 Tax=Nostoc minutum NIES-26 TaxID=1844469 RepID=A0A367RLX3_9NOSO|nr:ABC transporter substrate-binding protein [Nostoc minutum NIES-26]
MNRLFNTRRRFLQLSTASLLGLSASFALGSCNTKQTSGTSTTSTSASGIKTNVLRVGYQQAGDLVRVSGVLEKRLEPLGVKVEWLQFTQGPQLMEGMNVGRVDLGSVGNTPPIFAQAAGADIVYLVGRVPPVGRFYAFAVPPSSPIKDFKEIKGQKVVFQKGSGTHYFVLRALEEAGLKYSDIQPVSIPNVDAVSAFMQGKIPIWVGYDPALSIAEKQNKVRILRDSEGFDLPGGYYIGARKFSEENPQLLKIVIEEIQKIGKWADEHPKETAKLLVPETKLDLDIQEKVNSRSSFLGCPIDSERIKTQQRVIDYFYKERLLPKPLDIKEVLLTSEQYAAITPASVVSQR